MDVVADYKPIYKSTWLSSVSWYCLRIACGGEPGRVLTNKTYGAHITSGVQSFLVWLQLWLDWLTGRCQAEHSLINTQYNQLPNRTQKRRYKVVRTSVRQLWRYWFLSPKTLTRGQFMERLCVLSLLGRVHVYRIRRDLTKRKMRIKLFQLKYAWVREPMGAFGNMRYGIWCHHVWPYR